MTETVGLLEGLVTTRSIRRYTDEPIAEGDLATMLFAATRAPSGSNRQTFRFLVLRQGTTARRARTLLGAAARDAWAAKREHDGYDEGSGSDVDSPKSRLASVLDEYAERFEDHPVIVLACLMRHRAPQPSEGASVYPAVQNLLLAARALGYGGTLTMWHGLCESELREVLGIPDPVSIAATITLGRPAGRHGPVRRRPLRELVYEDRWGTAADWADDPPGTRFTSTGPRTPSS